MKDGSQPLAQGRSLVMVTWPRVRLADTWRVGRRSGRHGAGGAEGQTQMHRRRGGHAKVRGADAHERRSEGEVDRGGWGSAEPLCFSVGLWVMGKRAEPETSLTLRPSSLPLSRQMF